MSARKTAIYRALDTIVKENSPDVVITCLDKVQKIFENIIQFPYERKYRTLYFVNATLSKTVFPVKGSITLLTEAGFSRLRSI